MGLFATFRFLRRHPLTRERPFAGLARYLRWQIGSRLVPGPVAVPFVGAAWLLVRPGMTGATGNVYAGLHEFEDMAFVLHALRPGDLFVDVGANVGAYSVLAAAVAGADVVAFEPIAVAARALRENLALNGIASRVTVEERCVGARSGRVAMTSGEDTMNHVLPSGSDGDGVDVPVVALDEALGERTPLLVKIDVEGYEAEVLRGAARVLARPGLAAVILEANGSGRGYGHSDAELVSILEGHGFARFAYAPRARTLTRLAGPPAGEGNVLFVRDLARVTARVQEAAPFRVLDQEI